LTGAQRRGGDQQRQLADAQPAQRRVAHRIEVVHPQPGRALDARGLVVAQQAPAAAARAAGEQQEVVLAQRLDGVRRAAPRQVLRAGKQAVVDLPQPSRRQPRLVQFADADRQIEAVVHQIDHARRVLHLGAHPRMRCQVLIDPAAHRQHAELHAARQPQRAPRLGQHLLGDALGVLDRGQNAQRALEHLAADFGRRQRARAALEQLDAQLRLQ
jgi:hypothetical protein